MPESIVQVTEGTGKKLHTWQKTVGANTVEDEIVVLGDQYAPTYTIEAAAVSTATLDSHLLQVMAGASLKLYVRRVRIWQRALATASAMGVFTFIRLTTAGTGGTAVTARPADPADAAAGASGMILPTVKGTEGNGMGRLLLGLTQTAPMTNTNFVEWVQLPQSKAKIVAAGAANGFAIKNTVAIAAGTVDIEIELAELAF